MNLSEPFVRRPVATALLAVAILLAGMLAFRFLPVAPLPQFDFPTISISASLPGASPETMASAVATPLERRFGRIAGITEITSSSTLGSTSITLQFDLDRNVEAAAREVQGAIAAASGELPRNLPMRPSLRKVNPADAPILIVSVTSKSVPLPQVFETANTILAQKISQVQGVGQVFVGGGVQPAVRVRVNPQVLAASGLSMEDVRRSIAQTNASTPKGTLAGGSATRVVDANDQQFGAAAYGNVLLQGLDGVGRRLSDVATITDDVENQRVAGWTDAERSVLLFVRREPGANILETNERVKALLPALIASISPAIDVVVAMDRTQSIKASVREVELTLVLSVALVVLVVFVFLRSGRATLVPTVVVPLSLVGTFGIMYLLGYSIDNLSLMALTIATGFVVDDAIVVVENVARLIEEGHTPLSAALLGSKQIGFTIVSITLSLLAVFVPILFMGGVVGRLFREFAVTLSVAVALSAVLSLTLTPMLAAKLLRAHPPEPKPPGPLERGFESLARGYQHSLF
ncbi:MAG: acriflavine resistance protein B, partial [Proteobacteria bacterium]